MIAWIVFTKRLESSNLKTGNNMTEQNFIEDVDFEIIEPNVESATETALMEEPLSAEYKKVMDMNEILKNVCIMFPNGELRKMEI